MSIEEAVYALLSANTAIKEIVGDNIFPVEIPQAERDQTYYPAIVYELSDRQREQTHQGPNKLVKSTIIMSCLGPEYFLLKRLANNIRLALNGKSAALAAIYGNLVKGVFLDTEQDGPFSFDRIERVSLYPVLMKFTIQHWEELDE